ncbi:MAG: hypothetical protein ACREEC_14420 [Thermoplasmata archaeon]
MNQLRIFAIKLLMLTKVLLRELRWSTRLNTASRRLHLRQRGSEEDSKI